MLDTSKDTSTDATTISVVTPTFNRLERLKQVLDALEAQSFPLDQFEVIVILDGSSDGTDAYLQNMQRPLNLKHFVQTNQGPAAARNHGVAKAKGDIVLFIDDDVVPDSRLIEEHKRWHDSENEDVVVIGSMLTPPDFKLDPWTQWMQDRLAEQYHSMVSGEWQPTARQFYTGNTSLPRRLLLESGGFDPVFKRAEDVELAYRLADQDIRFLFNPGAKGYHYEERSFSSWLAIPYAYGRYDVIFAHQKGQSWLLDRIFREYHLRHPIIRGFTKACLDRPRLSKIVTSILKQLAIVGKQLKFGPSTRLACSSMFNLQLYQGIADELGGRKLFFAGVAGELSHPTPGGEAHQEALAQ